MRIVKYVIQIKQSGKFVDCHPLRTKERAARLVKLLRESLGCKYRIKKQTEEILDL